MKKSELDKKYQAAKQWIKDKEKKGNKKTTTKASTTLDKKYQAAKQYLSAREIGLDTFESDINKLNKSISTATSGWQTQETMKNTLSSVQSMYDRIGKYQEYQKQYGDGKLPDLSELQGTYKSSMDYLKSLSEEYGGYKDAKSYKKVADERKSLQTADLEKTKKEVAHLKATLETAAGYEDYLARPNDSQADALNIQNLYKDFLKKGGFESYEDIEKALSEKKRFLNNATRTQERIKLGSVSDINSENYDKDYEKYVKIGKGVNPEEVGTSKRKRTLGAGKARPVSTVKKSDTRWAAEALADFVKNGKNAKFEENSYDQAAIFSLMTEKEFNDLAYYIAKDKENGGNLTEQYMESIRETLNARRGEEIASHLKGNTFGQYLYGVDAGLDQFFSGLRNLTSEEDYIPVNQMQYASGQIREDLYKDSGWWARTGYDLVNTTSNMLPSILTSTLVGAVNPLAGQVVGTGLMGASAKGNAYQEMLNLGYDKSQASTYSTLVGLSEAGLQYALGGIGKLGGVSGKLAKAVNGIDNGLARFAIRFGGSMLAEGFEESAQEVLNPLFMNIAAGYDTGAEVDWGEVAYSGLLGALSGGLMEGPSLAVNSVAEHYQNKNIGENIRGNNQIKDVFDLASNPEIASAYDTYTRYAKKGINAENVSDVQLGRLWQDARTDTEGKKIVTPNAYEKLGEMARTPEAKIEAIINDAIASDINKRSKKTKKALGKDADVESIKSEIVDKATERLTELGQKDNVEEIANIIAKKSVGEDISAEEVKALRESEYGERVFVENDKGVSDYVKGMEDIEARIFTQAYDGNTDIEAFANSFNLVSEYAKRPESFTVEDAVKNKGVLSEDSAKYIYRQMKTNEELKAAEKNSELMNRIKNGERGIIDDSVINYGDKHISGTVHWNSLTERQRQAVIFAKGLYKALGSNLAFVGKNKKFNGAYNVTKDITFIDVFAGRDYRTWTGTDTIISTISHEITHEMKVKTPEAHKILTDLAFRALEKSTGLTKSELIAAEVEKLKNKGESHTDEDAIDEIVARACEDMLANSKEAKAMLKELSPAEQKTLVEKIQDIIQKIVDWIDEFLSSYKNQANSEEAKALREMKEEFEAMSAMWDKALREMKKFNKEVANDEVSNDTTSETESLNEMFADVSEAIGTDGKTLFQLESAKEDKVMHQDREQEYLKLAKDPVKNETRLMELVDAKAVESGVDTDSNGKPIALYHGTSDFGFTTVDTEYSDDKLTFWATSELAVAKSYNGHGFAFKPHEGVRQIGNPTEIAKNPRLDAQKDSATKIVETAAEVFPEYKDATVLTDKQKLKEAKKDIASAYKTAKKLMKSKELTEADAEFVGNFIDAVNEGTCEALTEACNVYEKVDTQRANSWFDDDVSRYEERFQTLTEKMEEIYEVVRPDYVLFDGDVVYTSYIAARYNAETGNSGVYKFYYKAEKPYVIDCKGENWNRIEPPAEISPTGERMTTRQIAKWAFENGYDSVKYVNAIDMGSKKVDSVSATVWAFMNPKEQLKSADPVTYDDDGNVIPLSERFNNKNDDIRYQDREEDIYDIMGERDTAIKRAEKLSEDVSRLKELLKLERRITKGKLYNESSVSGVANFLKNKFGSKIDKIKLMKALKEVYTYMASADENNLEADAIYSKCEEVARSILEGIAPVMDDYTKKILSDVRNTRVSLTEEQKAEVINRYGNNWPRYFIGSATVANDGAPLSSVWADLAEQYPDKFSKDITDADMGIELLEAVRNMKDSSEVVDKYLEEERVSQIATEIYNAYWNIPPVKTTADKYSEKIKAIRAEHRKAIKEVRESQKLADDIHYAQKMREQKKKLQKQTYARIKDARAKAKQQGKEIGLRRLESFKENANRKTVLQSTMATAMSLNKKLTTNSKEVHIPEELKPVVQELLNAIDFSSKQLLGMKGSKKDARGLPTKADMARENVLSKVHSMATEKSDVVSLRKAIKSALELFENAEKVLQSSSDGTVDSSVVALDTDMIKDINDMIESLDLLIEKGEKDLVLQKMSTESLETLNKMVKSINHWAIVADKALANKHKKRISDLGMQTVEETNEYGERQEYIRGIEDIKNFFNWNNLLPVNAFKRLGNAAMEFFNGLRDAQDKVTFNRQDVMDFTDELFKKYKQYKPKSWRTEVKSFDVKLPGENKTTKVTMPVSYIMSLYCVAKQEDAQRHLYGMDASGNKLTYKDEKGIVHDGGGMTIKGYKEGKFSIKVNKSLDNTIVNENIVKQITSVLTKEQIEVADALQKFMNETGSEWGDAVSMALYGIKKFGTENYFPITVSPHTLNADKIRDAKASLFSILNYGFTKERNPNAKQSIEIGDIFDVFANHMNMVAIYNAYALPIFDIARWYNFKAKTENGKEIAVTTSIEKAFGSGALTYVNNLIKDLNGQHESSRLGFISKIFKNTKVAMVGNSISVALLQPTAYLKAMVKIPPKYLLKSALYVRDFGAKKGVEKAKKYCGIALLKSQGYFETGVSANTTTKMLHDESFGEKVTEGSLKGAEFMDERTWGVLWNACEFEVRAERKDLEVGSEEFYKVIGEKLRDVIYETQVVDSPLTKSDLMRSSDTGAKMVTMFASEMTVAYNMVFEAAYQTHLDSKKYGKKQALKKNAKNLSMTLIAYTLTSVANAALNVFVDSLRHGNDDEDENEFLKNFIADWMIVGKIPYFKEAISLAQGYSSSRTDTLWLQSAFKAYEYWSKEGASTKSVDEALKSLSYLTGVSAYNFTRDIRALLRFIGLTD